MRYVTLFFFILYSNFSFIWSNEKIDTLKIGVISDIHYLSEKLMDNGEAIKNYDRVNGKVVCEIPSILKQVFDDYMNNNMDILFISGDITKDGEKQSHIDFVKKLRPLMNKGVRIFVIPGNHDINVPNPQAYKDNKSYTVENVSPEQFTKIYASCGYGNALKRDVNSLSYVAELNPSTWLIAIDSNRYKEYTDRTISGGRISQQTEQWIIEIMAEAKQKNIQVIGMMHHSLIEHIMMQSMFFGEYIVEDSKRLASLFADMGMKAIFTGHFHANDITEYTSPTGHKIYDLETGSLSAYTFPYRFVELSPIGMKISTKNILSTPSNPNLADDNKTAIEDIAKRLTPTKLNSRGITFPPEITQLISEIIAKIFIKHLEGNEVVDKDLELRIQQLSNQLDSPVDTTQLSKLDIEPADNNVEIQF